MNLSYPKKEKLKSKKRIEQLFVEGKNVTSFPLKLIYLETALPDQIKVQTGVAVSKKKFKSAVKRNRIKRLLREAYRLNKTIVLGNTEKSYAFLILYIGKEMPTYAVIEKQLHYLFQKFNAKTNA
ncbi:ribonuclease P protein component [Maribacter vaceletii]|uniref:Ribonuclease P protein component n=1 Tax=Maribacter vaceletii TaxID=1206816 RepID=A0A495EDV8_9FLAO|nr:ribonuclease P protein component [Maribacter vaceletii]RKR14829.1 ribonuclease P protein component [Maribacter vaceletii]